MCCSNRAFCVVLLLTVSKCITTAEADRCQNVPDLSYIASPNACYLYYSCINGIAYPQICPQDEWFSMQQQQCVPKEESECVLTEPPVLPEAPAPEPNTLCYDVPNFRYIASVDSCQWYYQCIDQIAYLLSCPLFSWFDEILQRCGSRYGVDCDIAPSTLTPVATPPTVDPLDICNGQPDSVLIASNTLCERYYSCYMGIAYPNTCPSGMWFNRNTNECDDPENVECDAKPRIP